MKICLSEYPDELTRYDAHFEALAAHIQKEQPDIVLLPEMPFTPWIFCTDQFDQAAWDHCVEQHALWLEKFGRDLKTALITSRPINLDGKRLNQAIYMDASGKITGLRSKYFLPNDYPAIEVPWFDRGDVFELDGIKAGIQLCSELMYGEIPRVLGMRGASLLFQARATGDSPRWRAAAILAAATSGAFVLGANRRSHERDWFSGSCWAYSPDGECLGETTAEEPIITVTLDLSKTETARSDYPMTMFKALS